MSKRLYIFEKPDAAMKFGGVFGIAGKGDGYITTKEGDYLSWCFGHLIEQAEPDYYTPDDVPRSQKTGKKMWRFEELPILPEQWQMLPKKDRNGDDSSVRKQIATIKRLAGEVNEIVHAGDPEREGQLIVDELLEYINNKKPVARLWLNALDEGSIRKAYAAICSNDKCSGYYYAGLGRQRTDWLIGMNLTRAATLAAKNGQVYTNGRVQSPTLALVVERDLAIAHFKPIDYFELSAQFAHTEGQYRGLWQPKEDQVGLDSEGRLIDAQIAKSLADKINNQVGVVKKVESKKGSEAPPLPWDITSLQAAASKRFGFTSDETLALVQKMYQAGYVSYPRVDSRHLPRSQFDDAANILQVLSSYGMKQAQGVTPKLCAMYNDSKVTAHHAIIPTGQKPTPETEKEKKVFELIATNFILNFYPDYEYLTTTIHSEVDGELFKTTGRVPTSMGWKGAGVEVDEDEVEDDASGKLPAVKQGDSVKVTNCVASAKKTQPPKPFTEATLLAAMENIHRFVSDPKAKAMLREGSGLGTGATRAAIIKELIDGKRYLERKGKNTIISTDAGREVIKAFPVELRDPVFTAMMEDFLMQVQEGKKNLSEFMQQQEAYVVDGIMKLKKATYGEGVARGCNLSDKQRAMLAKSSDKSIFALAKKKNLTPEDCAKAKAYLDELFAKMKSQQASGMRNLSDKQRAMLAKSNDDNLVAISQKSEVTLEEFEQAKAYIDNYFSQQKSNPTYGGSGLSDKQMAVIEKNAPENIKKAAKSGKPDDIKKCRDWLNNYFASKK